MSLKAATASAVITPPLPVQLAGHRGKRVADSVADDLCARVLALTDGGELSICVSMDLLWLERRQVLELRRLIAIATGAREDAVFIACTHTHSGPDTLDWYDFAPPLDEVWLAAAFDRTARAAQRAATCQREVSLEVGFGQCDLAVNRRLPRGGQIVREPNPGGPVDRRLTVLLLREPAGPPIACIAVFALHPVILGTNSLAVSGDWCGVTARTVEQRLGCDCLVWNGATADNNPKVWTGARYEEMLEVGAAVAAEVCAAAGRAVPASSSKVAHCSATLGLPHKPHPYLRVAQQRRLQRDGGLVTEVHAMRLGPLAIVGLPGECLSETAWAVAAGRSERCCVVSYAGDYVGYLPLPHVCSEGGYEAEASMTTGPGVLQLVEAGRAAISALFAAEPEPPVEH